MGIFDEGAEWFAQVVAEDAPEPTRHVKHVPVSSDDAPPKPPVLRVVEDKPEPTQEPEPTVLDTAGVFAGAIDMTPSVSNVDVWKGEPRELVDCDPDPASHLHRVELARQQMSKGAENYYDEAFLAVPSHPVAYRVNDNGVYAVFSPRRTDELVQRAIERPDGWLGVLRVPSRFFPDSDLKCWVELCSMDVALRSGAQQLGRHTDDNFPKWVTWHEAPFVLVGEGSTFSSGFAWRTWLGDNGRVYPDGLRAGYVHDGKGDSLAQVIGLVR